MYEVRVGRMFEVDNIVATICGEISRGQPFEPSSINLTDYFISSTKGDTEETFLVNVDQKEGMTKTQAIVPKYPIDRQVIAIDSTSITLGQIPDGLVGAIRASIITKPAGRTEHSLEKYGPYLIPVTNQNKEQLYQKTFKAVYGIETHAHAPDCSKTLDRIRNFLERYLQLRVTGSCIDSLILMDGSLIGGTVADPKSIMKNIVSNSNSRKNSLVAVSKSTGLTLRESQKNILSLLDDKQAPCYIGDIRDRITQQKERYLGSIYVARLAPLGEPFRIDIPPKTPTSHSEIFNEVAGLAEEDGYPEELRLAHMTCVHSSIEIIELQSAAITLHGLTLKEELRRRIFPL